MAGGLRIARLLEQKYHHTREAYAAGKLLTAQVRVIVNACEQAPPEATASQTAQAEELLVGKATGEASRSGRGLNPKRLRQAARRMYDLLDTELADRHEAILLGRETRHARAETYLQLNDNATAPTPGSSPSPRGSWGASASERLEGLHGNLFKAALDRLTAPRRRSRLPGEDGASESIEDRSAPTSRNHWALRDARSSLAGSSGTAGRGGVLRVVPEERAPASVSKGCSSTCPPTATPPTASPCW